MTLPILYSFRRCPYAMRARMGIAISAMVCELREVKLSEKPDSMLAASPKGTVPVLILPDGRVIDESIDILRHALHANDPEGWLLRDDAELIAANDGAFKQDLDRYKYPDRHNSDPLHHRAAGMAFLRRLDERLSTSRELGGDRRGIADAAIMPFVRQFASVDRGWFDAQPTTHVKAWLDRHLASPLFNRVMLRVPPWQAGEEQVLFGEDIA